MDKQLESANDPSASCTNMVNFGPVTPEIEVCEICTFETMKKKKKKNLFVKRNDKKRPILSNTLQDPRKQNI